MNSVSVVIPYHNRPEFIRQAVESVSAQTVPPQEVLVVDDCSRPENWAAIEPLGDRARLLRSEVNQGLAGARNYGARHATGDWLAFNDDDDFWLPNKLERQLLYLEQHPDCDAVIAAARVLYPDGSTADWIAPARRVDLQDALYRNPGTVITLLVRRSVFAAVGGFDAALRGHEDHDLCIRIVAAGYRLDYLAEPLVVYRRGGPRPQLSRQHLRMLDHRLYLLGKHRDLYRQAFGPWGPWRTRARFLRETGVQLGGPGGRLLWLAGWLLAGGFVRDRYVVPERRRNTSRQRASVSRAESPQLR